MCTNINLFIKKLNKFQILIDLEINILESVYADLPK